MRLFRTSGRRVPVLLLCAVATFSYAGVLKNAPSLPHMLPAAVQAQSAPDVAPATQNKRKRQKSPAPAGTSGAASGAQPPQATSSVETGRPSGGGKLPAETPITAINISLPPPPADGIIYGGTVALPNPPDATVNTGAKPLPAGNPINTPTIALPPPPAEIYRAPGSIATLSEGDLQKPITFRWPAVAAVPREGVTYRLRIWQLTQGQTGAEAIKSNQPIIIKDIDDLTEVVIPNLSNQPCKAPYLCEFVSTVQAFHRIQPIGGGAGIVSTASFRTGSQGAAASPYVVDGVPTTRVATPTAGAGGNGGKTPPQSFQTAPIIEKDAVASAPQGAPGVVVVTTKKGQHGTLILKPLTLHWTPVVSVPKGGVTYRLRVWQMTYGQIPYQAIKANQPIIIKDVDNLTETVVSDLQPHPCELPDVCDFVWTVEALSHNGKPIAGYNGDKPTVIRYDPQTEKSFIVTDPGEKRAAREAEVNLYWEPTGSNQSLNQVLPDQSGAIKVDKQILEEQPIGQPAPAQGNGTATTATTQAKPAAVTTTPNLKQNPGYDTTAPPNTGDPVASTPGQPQTTDAKPATATPPADPKAKKKKFKIIIR